MQETPKIRIMVNFDKRKTIHTYAAIGTIRYKDLLSKGYVQTGEIKIKEGCFKVFWNPDYFDPIPKYQRYLEGPPNSKPVTNAYVQALNADLITKQGYMGFVFSTMLKRNPMRDKNHLECPWSFQFFWEVVQCSDNGSIGEGEALILWNELNFEQDGK